MKGGQCVVCGKRTKMFKGVRRFKRYCSNDCCQKAKNRQQLDEIRLMEPDPMILRARAISKSVREMEKIKRERLRAEINRLTAKLDPAMRTWAKSGLIAQQWWRG